MLSRILQALILMTVMAAIAPAHAADSAPAERVMKEQLRTVQNVKLELCEITRESVDLPKDRIIPGVLPVRSGVVRIADLEHHGYAYLKAE